MLEPRKMWPGGAFGARGKIAAEESPTLGRTLVFADAPEWRETIAALFGRDAPAPDGRGRRLRAAARPAGGRLAGRAPRSSSTCRAAGCPLMTARVADHLASVGRLDRASLPAPAAPVPTLRELSSADEAAYWRDALDARRPGAGGGRPVPCCSSSTPRRRCGRSPSRAALLRRAGAGAVLPLLVHRRP